LWGHLSARVVVVVGAIDVHESVSAVCGCVSVVGNGWALTLAFSNRWVMPASLNGWASAVLFLDALTWKGCIVAGMFKGISRVAGRWK
jgi:hypothetical protein